MNEDKIKELAEKEFVLAEQIADMRMMNANVPYEQRKQQAIDFAVLTARHYAVLQELNKAQREEGEDASNNT